MEDQLVHDLDPQKSTAKPYLLILGFVFIVILGTVAGYMMSRSSASTVAGTSTFEEKAVKTSNEAGLKKYENHDKPAVGVLEAGGLNGEGTHKLIRDGGPSQTVYLVSSVIDLNEYVGKKIEVRGDTMKATKAPWLMDVGYLKILE
jgi:hypothetical protein